MCVLWCSNRITHQNVLVVVFTALFYAIFENILGSLRISWGPLENNWSEPETERFISCFECKLLRQWGIVCKVQFCQSNTTITTFTTPITWNSMARIHKVNIEMEKLYRCSWQLCLGSQMKPKRALELTIKNSSQWLRPMWHIQTFVKFACCEN